MKLNKKVLRIMQSIIIVTIFFIVIREIYKILVDIDIDLFNKYADKITFFNLIAIFALGIISYIPLSFYDLVTRKSIPINLPVRKVYKYSWISSSISSLVGFGGSSAIFIKNYFYKNYVEDSSKLMKENVKVVGLNLSGFSLICLIYSVWCFFTTKNFDIVFFVSMLIGMYIIVVSITNTYKLIINKDSKYITNIKIMLISILEWATTILLIYGLIVILDIKVTLLQFFPVYIKAIIIAIISMVPGGVGTFDLTLLTGLQKFNVQSEQVFLLIILYRISYYFIPALIGAILYLVDLYQKADSEIRVLISRVNSKISTSILTIMVYITGILLIFWITIDIQKIIPRESIFNIEIMDFSICVSIILGFILIALASILDTKTKSIYYILIGIFSIITLISLMYARSFNGYLVLFLSWMLIILSKDRFYRKGFIFTWKNAVKSISIVFSLFSISLVFIFLQLNDIAKSEGKTTKFSSMIKEIYKDRVTLYVVIAVIITISLIIILLNINKYNKFPKGMLNKTKIMDLIAQYGGSSLAHYVFVGDKYVYINKLEDVFLQYQIVGGKIIVLGNPVGNKASFFEAIREFYDLADLYGYTLAFTGVSIDVFSELHDMGFDFMKLGQDASVELEDFSLAGNKNKSKRQAVSRIAKAGYTFSIETPPFTDELFKELEEVSNEWLNGRKEKGFCVGYFNREYISMDKIAIVRNSDNEIKAFATIMPMYDNETLSVDLMRFKNIELNGIMDYIFVNLFEYSKENGYKYFNLGLVPLADVGETNHSFLREKIAYQIFVNGNFIYSFNGLKKFKDKYATKWEDRYLAYKKESSLVITLLQLLKLLSEEKDN